MLNGRLFLTMNFWKHMSMEWWLSFVITNGTVLTACIRLFRGLQGKVRSHCTTEISIIQVRHRIIIVGIRNLGLCPCPRCLIPMVRVPNMGMSRDLAQRVSLVRVDDVDRRARVQAARTAIYENNHLVNGAAIKRLLDRDSLVPSIVSVFFSEI